MSDCRIVDLSREEAIDILLRLTQENVHQTSSILVLDDVITKDECDWILTELEKNNYQNYPRFDNYSVRGGQTYPLSNFKSIDQFVYDRVATKIYETMCQNSYYAYYFNTRHGYHGLVDLGYDYCRYTGDEVLVPHTDGVVLRYDIDDFLVLNSDIEYYPFVVASSTLMLNDLDEGGELVFPNQNISIQQKAGRVVIWNPNPSFIHQTNPLVENTERHVIVSWFALKDYVMVEPDRIRRNES